ncbi:hypothetical protein B0H14DRAFT_3433072 [Mycena olivaceomarginata]|nr:hypothetical protein B0H14DRAFT_3433072 [Mycena olivaceomarginata]
MPLTLLLAFTLANTIIYELGLATDHFILLGEVSIRSSRQKIVGAILVLDVIKGNPRLTNAHVFTDCQPAILAIANPRPSLANTSSLFHTLHRRLLRASPTLWLSTHARRRRPRAPPPPSHPESSPSNSPHPTSRAAMADEGNQQFLNRWIAEWSASPRFQRISLFDLNAFPRLAVARVLSRPQCSILTQLHTVHFALNAYLCRFHLTPSPDCALCLVPGTVYHRERHKLILAVGTGRLSLRRLLSVKSDPKPVLRYVRDTGRFPRYEF